MMRIMGTQSPSFPTKQNEYMTLVKLISKDKKFHTIVGIVTESRNEFTYSSYNLGLSKYEISRLLILSITILEIHMLIFSL